MTLGERIQELRKNEGLSQEALGEALGVTRQSISKWESDAAIPELDKLIAMSRLFRLTVGELLGVEDPGEPHRELTDRELQALAAIAEKLTPPAQEPREPAPSPAPPPRKRRWPKVLAVCAALALLLLGARTARRLEALEQQVGNLQNNISAVDRNVSSQVSSITQRVEEALESQNRVAADMGCAIAQADLPGGTVTFRVWAVPRTYREGMTALFSAAGGDFDTRTAQGAEGEGHRFEALVTCPLADEVTLTVTFQSGEESQNQIVSREGDLLTLSFPQIYTGTVLFFADLEEVQAGEFHIRMDLMDLNFDPGYLRTEDGVTEIPATECTLRLWREGNCIWSWETGKLNEDGSPKELEPALDLALPDLREGEVFLLSALATDSAGRTWETFLDCAQVSRRGETGIPQYDLDPCSTPETLPWE